jgi:hypothetical protein
MRNLRLPFDHLAADECSSALRRRALFRGGELLQLPYTSGLDRAVQSQHYWVHLNRNAHVPNADALRLLPCEQQLHPQFDGLLWLPSSGFHEHHVDGWERTEPRDGGVSDNGFGLRNVSLDYYLGCGSL